jgi:hypothetical protein
MVFLIINHMLTVPPHLSIAFFNSVQVIDTGTILPSLIRSLISFPSSLSDLAASRRRSPQEKWTKLYFSISRSHWVFFPDPGAL